MSHPIHSIKLSGATPNINKVPLPTTKVLPKLDFDGMIKFGEREFNIIQNSSDKLSFKDSKFTQLMYLQRVINDYTLKMNMVSKIAEALTTTIRKFQQQ